MGDATLGTAENMNLTRWVVLGMGCAWLAFNAYQAVPKIESEMATIRYNLHRSDAERYGLRNFQRNQLPFCDFVNARVPENAVVAVPPKQSIPYYQVRLSQLDVMRYFLFPRTLVYGTDLKTLQSVDAIVVSQDYPPQYPRDHFISFPCNDHPLRVRIYLDKIRIRDRNGKTIFADDFRYPPEIERLSRLQRKAVIESTAADPQERFEFMMSRYERSQVFDHGITTERSKNDRYSEWIDLQIGPRVDTWFGYRIEGIPLSEIGQMEIWTWATERAILRVGLRCDNGQFIRSLRNLQVHSWEKMEIDNMDELIEESGIQDPKRRQADAIVISLNDFNFLSEIGLIENPR